MAKTLYIGDDVKVLFRKQDLFDLVREHMGDDTVICIQSMLVADQKSQAEYERELQEAYNEGASDAWSQQDFEEYENGKEDGYAEGYSEGYGKGYAEGFAEGYQKRGWL